MEVIVGTAGHIDHGKTALVKALTGVDADRLPEEKRRGITIELGFAELDLGELRIGFIDVPGHERFVKNVLAGAHGIDLVALVIAADEGVMPQTREHFDICRLLAVKTGLIILTKIDLVDEEMLELAKLDARGLVKNSFLENAPIVCVSAKTGEGLPELNKALRDAASKVPARNNNYVARLPIDRVFSVKGFGAVVTGTLVSGEIKTGDELELLPAGKKVRVRNLQVHGKDVENSIAGNRVAVNLGGINTSDIERGMTLAPPGALSPTRSIDVQMEVLPGSARPLKTRQRVRVHLGASEVLGRLQIIGEANGGETGEISAGQSGFAQIRLESEIVAIAGERFVIRSYSPQITIAGGTVLNNSAVRHRRKDFAEVKKWLEEMTAAKDTGDKQTQLKLFLAAAGEHGLTATALQSRTGWRDRVLGETIQTATGAVIDAGGIFLDRENFETLAAKTVAEIESFHQREPLARGMLKETLREKLFSHLPVEVFHKTLHTLEDQKKILAEKDTVRASSYHLDLTSPDQAIRQKLLDIYCGAGLEVPVLDSALAEAAGESSVSKDHARRIAQLLLDSGELVRVSPELLFHRDEIHKLVQNIRAFAGRSSDRLIDISIFKELAGVSRKYAIPLLEYLDREKITRRAGDKRLVL
ncbi:MAG TPA: selenocysteine-specific translation elongation factor [Pyrinomonadaceae bacterium]|nr:selenocysteine-specific translation elongation factor [Pyrinomonadaceae bacterium]